MPCVRKNEHVPAPRCAQAATAGEIAPERSPLRPERARGTFLPKGGAGEGRMFYMHFTIVCR